MTQFEFELEQAAWEYYLNLDSHHFEEKQHNNIYTDAFEAGAEWADNHPKKGLVSIDNVCNMLYAMLSTQDINDYDYVIAPAYDNVVDFVEDFRKTMEG